MRATVLAVSVLAASCDLIVADADAQFHTPSVDMSLFCLAPMVALLRAASSKHAMEMLHLGPLVSAGDAFRFGLVNRLVSAGCATATALDWAVKITAQSALAIFFGKPAFYRQSSMTTESAHFYAGRVMIENLLQAEASKGISAFLGKRPPRWSHGSMTKTLYNLAFGTLLAVGHLFAGAMAQTPSLKTFEPVMVTYDDASLSQPDLSDLVKKLIRAADAKDLAPIGQALASNFVAYNCPADAVSRCARNAPNLEVAKLTPAERLRLAFCCRGRPNSEISIPEQTETLFAMLQAIFSSRSLGRDPASPGAVCTPAPPVFDRKRAVRVANANGVDKENLLVAAHDLDLRDKPDEKAAVVYQLKLGEVAFVANNLTAEMPAGWTALATPKGVVGFAFKAELNELAPAAVCFTRSGVNKAWAIAYTIQRGE